MSGSDVIRPLSVVVPLCNSLTLKPEQSGVLGSIPGRTPPLERHDKGSRTQFSVAILGILSQDLGNFQV